MSVTLNGTNGIAFQSVRPSIVCRALCRKSKKGLCPTKCPFVSGAKNKFILLGPGVSLVRRTVLGQGVPRRGAVTR